MAHKLLLVVITRDALASQRPSNGTGGGKSRVAGPEHWFGAGSKRGESLSEFLPGASSRPSAHLRRGHRKSKD